jgi:hypothetical protein
MDFLRDGSVPASLFLYGIFSIGISIVCFLLAKDKGRNTVIAAVVGLIPGVNYLAIAYYIGVSKLGRV